MMDFKADISILEAESTYKAVGKRLTDIALQVEATCLHEVWCGKDTSSSNYGGSALEAVYICLNCRMEVHILHARYLSEGKSPEGSLILKPTQCGVGEIYDLRINGDNRDHLRKKYSSDIGWPKRPPVATEIVEKDGEVNHAG